MPFITLAGLTAAAGYAASAVSVAVSVASAAIAIKQGNDQKKQANAAAKMEEDAALTEAMLKKAELARIQGTIRANSAAAGADADTGSSFALQESNKTLADIDIGLSAKKRSQRAFQLRTQGANAKTAGILTGISSLVSASASSAKGISNYNTLRNPKVP
tara:strand:- start:8433 stop:8912 length:480 start_codon:yes stop_codon:yes gene_type:complete